MARKAAAPIEGANEQEGTQDAKPQTVAMVRNPEEYPAPHSADVHPDEVQNYRVNGWVVKE